MRRTSTFRLRIALAALALAALTAFAGCGGGSSDSASTQAALPSPPANPDSGGGQANEDGKKQAPDAKRRVSSKPNPGNGKSGAKEGAEKTSPGNSRQVSALISEAKKLIAGNGKGPKTVSSKKKIRKIVEELREGSREQGEPAKSPNEVVEEILGR